MLPRIDAEPIPAPDVEVEWLTGLRFGRQLRDWMPESFQAYARILHPASMYSRGDDPGGRLVWWDEVAAWSGKTLEPTSSFEGIQVRSDGAVWREQHRGEQQRNGPFESQLVRPAMDRLGDLLSEATSTPGDLWMLVWVGYGGSALRARDSRKFELSISLTRSGRGYFLCRGRFEPSGDERWGPAFTEPPSFWWPQDRAWFVSTDIDLSCTYVGGSVPLVERVLADDALGAFPSDLNHPYGGDPLPS